MKRALVLLVLAVTALGFAGCGGGGGGTTSYVPTWISASWWGGATGDPQDRRDEDAIEWVGSICPASSMRLESHVGFAGVCVYNNCEARIDMSVCRTKGTIAEPDDGLYDYECATDPFDTPGLRLLPISLNPGTDGYCFNAQENIDINIFFCSSSQMLNILTTPLRCL